MFLSSGKIGYFLIPLKMEELSEKVEFTEGLEMQEGEPSADLYTRGLTTIDPFFILSTYRIIN